MAVEVSHAGALVTSAELHFYHVLASMPSARREESLATALLRQNWDCPAPAGPSQLQNAFWTEPMTVGFIVYNLVLP